MSEIVFDYKFQEDLLKVGPREPYNAFAMDGADARAIRERLDGMGALDGVQPASGITAERAPYAFGDGTGVEVSGLGYPQEHDPTGYPLRSFRLRLDAPRAAALRDALDSINPS